MKNSDINSLIIGDKVLNWIGNFNPYSSKVSYGRILNLCIQSTGFLPRLALSKVSQKTGGFEKGVESLENKSYLKGFMILAANGGVALAGLIFRVSTIAFIILVVPVIAGGVVGAVTFNPLLGAAVFGGALLFIASIIIIHVAISLIHKGMVYFEKTEVLNVLPEDFFTKPSEVPIEDESITSETEDSGIEIEEVDSENEEVRKEKNWGNGFWHSVDLGEGNIVQIFSQFRTDIFRTHKFIIGEKTFIPIKVSDPQKRDKMIKEMTKAFIDLLSNNALVGEDRKTPEAKLRLVTRAFHQGLQSSPLFLFKNYAEDNGIDPSLTTNNLTLIYTCKKNKKGEVLLEALQQGTIGGEMLKNEKGDYSKIRLHRFKGHSVINLNTFKTKNSIKLFRSFESKNM